MYLIVARATLFLIPFAAFCSVRTLGQQIVLGVLEDNPGHYSGDPNPRAVRAVFKKNGPDWEPFPSHCPDQDCLKKIASNYPGEVTWTVAFDGKNLGQVTANTPKEYGWYSSVGQEEITSKGPVPTIGERSSDFAGWPDAPVYRPLMAISQPYFKDPESWKPAQLSSDLSTLLRGQFRKKFPKVTNCESPDENVPNPWSYRDQNIKILKSYSARNGWSIARLRLEEHRCDGPPDDSFSDQWFAISPDGQVRFLDHGMRLVDAGDYDNDGKSELVFSIDRYNHGGYELFYDDFEKHVTFEYNYH
jgi:hypothetical protein